MAAAMGRNAGSCFILVSPGWIGTCGGIFILVGLMRMSDAMQGRMKMWLAIHPGRRHGWLNSI
jgi:hypothetical protein